MSREGMDLAQLLGESFETELLAQCPTRARLASATARSPSNITDTRNGLCEDGIV
jgi:hypothetical protein